jgi:hypothetical protein
MNTPDNTTDTPGDNAAREPQPDGAASIADNARRMLAVSRAYLSDALDLA